MRGLLQNKGARIAATATTTLLMGRHVFAQTTTDRLSIPPSATVESGATPVDAAITAPSTGAASPSTSSAPALANIAQPGATTKADSKKVTDGKFEDTSGITDLRLKAEQGSMSKYSGKFNFAYQGPVIDDPSNPYQPDPDGSLTHNPTSLRGSVSFRIRESAESAINLGTGISRVTPFTEDARTDVSTPFVSYDHTQRIRAYQLRESVEGSMVTNPEMKNVGQFGGLAANFAVIRNIHYSRWEVGVDSNFQMGLYSRPYDPGPPNVAHTESRAHQRSGIMARQNIGDGNASTFSAGLGPSVRFRISDAFGTFASVHFNYFEPRASQGALQIQHKTMTGRTGVDIAVSHAIFVSPFLTFYPDALTLSSTTINFSTIFSIF